MNDIKDQLPGVELYNVDECDLVDYTDLTKSLSSVSSAPLDTPTTPSYNDNLFYIYTSGTTGLPKAATIKHSRFVCITYALFSGCRVRPDDIIYAPMPFYHSA